MSPRMEFVPRLNKFRNHPGKLQEERVDEWHEACYPYQTNGHAGEFWLQFVKLFSQFVEEMMIRRGAYSVITSDWLSIPSPSERK